MELPPKKDIMQRLIAIFVLLLVGACGSQPQPSKNLDLYALLRAAAPTEAQLMQAVRENTANMKPADRPSELSVKAYSSQAHYVFQFELNKVGERIVGNLGYIDYQFVYQEVGGPIYEGEITANFVFQTNKFVADVPPYTVQGGGVTSLLIGNVQNALLDALSPSVSRDAPLLEVLVTVTYSNGNVRGAKTDSNGNFSFRVFNNASVVLKATYEDFEEFETNYVIGAGANPVLIDLWPRPTLVNAGLTQVSGQVVAANAPELVATEGAAYPVQGALVSLTLPSGRVLISTTNANGQYLLVAVPPGVQTIEANKGSKRGEVSYNVTLSGTNDNADIAFPDTRPYCVLTVNQSTVVAGATVTLQVAATDADVLTSTGQREPLYFTYDSNPVAGTFLDLPGYEENTNRWLSPTTPGSYTLSATVSDGAISYTCEAPVTVQSPQPPPQPTPSGLGRYGHGAVWATDKMLVWGGQNALATNLSSGYEYSSSTNWTALSLMNGPSAAYQPAAVWTGTQMIVWGFNQDNLSLLNTGRYQPDSQSWVPIDTAGAPIATGRAFGFWDANPNSSKAVFFSSSDASVAGTYDPAANEWTSSSMANGPSGRISFSTVWTGNQLIVFGGYTANDATNSGARWDPDTDTWQPIQNAPYALAGHSAVWTGSKMLVFGGRGPGCCHGNVMNVLMEYDPVSDNWNILNNQLADGTPVSVRVGHHGFFADGKMYVFGGFTEYYTYSPNTGTLWFEPAVNTGFVYDTSNNTWVPMADSPVQTMVDGNSTIVSDGLGIYLFGGQASTTLDTFARYDLTSGAWTLVP